jgi:hypothetical protein
MLKSSRVISPVNVESKIKVSVASSVSITKVGVIDGSGEGDLRNVYY